MKIEIEINVMRKGRGGEDDGCGGGGFEEVEDFYYIFTY